jgi:2',3'-cyclic-nucleotide 2'-phosphodiesterase
MADSSLKILVIGDIVGRVGRIGITQFLETYKKEKNPDLVIGNVENLAHGKGVTERTLDEMKEAGIDVFTSGNHIWRKPEGIQLLSTEEHLIRPANYPPGAPGKGTTSIQVGAYEILVINLLGRVYMRDDVDDPFRAIDEILEAHKSKTYAAILVDFHAEASSEKAAFGWYCDGRITTVWGTHTHVPTADGRLLLKGTGFISDVGMTGPYDSVIGVESEVIIKGFTTGLPVKHEYAEEGTAIINAVELTIDPINGTTKTITSLQRLI